jgi:hypothetical protein
LLWCDSPTIEQSMDTIKQDLMNVIDYLNMCKLKLNVNKTKFMIIGTQCDINSINLNGDVIERVPEIKYLGVVIDEALTFKENAQYVGKKISKMVGFLNRNRKKIPMKVRLTLYKCMIGSMVDYCSSILFLNKDNEINMLQKIQNRALRNITHGNRYSRVTDMLQETNLLSIKQRIIFNVLLLIYKATKNLLPNYLTVNIIRTADIQPYHLRNNSSLRPPSHITHRNQDSIWYKGVRLFNQMAVKFDVNCDNVYEFEKSAVIFVKEIAQN